MLWAWYYLFYFNILDGLWRSRQRNSVKWKYEKNNMYDSTPSLLELLIFYGIDPLQGVLITDAIDVLVNLFRPTWWRDECWRSVCFQGQASTCKHVSMKQFWILVLSRADTTAPCPWIFRPKSAGKQTVTKLSNRACPHNWAWLFMHTASLIFVLRP